MKERSRGNHRHSGGSSTLEILLAFAILMLTFSAVIMVFFSNQTVSLDTQLNDEALYKASLQLEAARSLSRANFSSVVSTGPTTDGIYSKTLQVTTLPDTVSKQVTSNVSYQTGGRNLLVSLSTILTRPIAAGNTCNPALPGGDWKNPRIYTFGTPGLNPKDSSNGLGISDIRAYNGELYLSAYSAPNTDDTFFIFDIPNDPLQPPVYVGSVNNDPALASPDLNALSLAQQGGKLYAYVANAYGYNYTTCTSASSCHQMQVIDVTDKLHPAVVANFKVPGVTGKAGQAVGISVFYSNGYVFLGLSKPQSGPEFHMIDVGGGGVGSPTNPVEKASYTIGSGITSMFVKNKLAYIVSPNSQILKVIDVDPASATFMTQVGSFSTPSALPGSNGVGSNYGESVQVIGNTAYLGRTYGTNEFYALNAINPAALAEYAPSSHTDVGTGNLTSVNGLEVRDYLAFLLTNAQFQVWNVSDPTHMYAWSADGTTNTFLAMSSYGGAGTAMHCDGDRFYVGIQSSAGNNKDIIAIILPGLTVPTITLSAVNQTGSTITTGTIGDIVHGNLAINGTAGTPSGTADFTYYTNGTCTAPGAADTGNPFVLTGGSANSTGHGPLSPGSYSFKAHYYGDANYNPGDSACSPFTIPQSTPVVSTIVKPSASVTVGTAVYDTVSVSGTTGTPTGNVTFTLYKKSNCTGSIVSTESTSLFLGAAQSSPTTQPKGNYCYKVQYNGDVNYAPAAAAIEPFVVN